MSHRPHQHQELNKQLKIRHVVSRNVRLWQKKEYFSCCDLDLWYMTLTFERDRVKMNQYAKY